MVHRRDFLQYTGGWLLTGAFSPFLTKNIQTTELIPQPKWTNWPKVRNVNNSNWGTVLNDIDSHMPSGHIYRDKDKVTHAHETTHGINSNIRNNAYRQQNKLYILSYNRKIPLSSNSNKKFIIPYPIQVRQQLNGFYCLQNQAVIINEPNTHIRNVAKLVPNSLRGGTYQLYLISQANAWGDTPLYIFDEWSAYTSGAECRLDLKIKNRAETLKFAIEFIVYSSCVPWASGSKDQQLKNFLMWNTYRVRWLYDNSVRQLGEDMSTLNYIKTMQTSQDAEDWRRFMREYCGQEYCKFVLGI